MPKGDSPLLGIDVLRLVIATQKKALPQAQRLIERAGQMVVLYANSIPPTLPHHLRQLLLSNCPIATG
jgi:hypothetical protein